MADSPIQNYPDVSTSSNTKVFALNPGDEIGWVDYPEDAQTPADVASAVSAHDADQNAHATIQASVTVAQNAAAAAQADATQALADAATAGGGTATHIADPDDAHAASAISVADAGSHFAGAEVEAALQDLAGRSDTAAAAIATNTSDLTTKADITDVANDIDTHDNDPTAHNGIAATVSEKVTKSGDTMTGPLLLSGAPTTDLEAATKKYVDDNAGGGTGSPPYDDTQVKADIATNTAGLAAEVTARTDGDAALAAQIAALPAQTPPYDDTAVKSSVTANTQAITAETTARTTADTGLDTRVTALENAGGQAAQVSALDATTGQLAIGGVEMGDTGWRDVLSLAPDADPASVWQLRRSGNVVNLTVGHPPAWPGTLVAAWNPLIALPRGFSVPLINPVGFNGQTAARFNITQGQLRYYGTSPLTNWNVQATWLTDDPWPTTLPGTPA